ncbi:MAG: hypothetical protein KVP17_000570 [Porospora cf. gigantea B]|uniref:uncharacterized protein n=1 Tax=Porospora cf. gigantea B TaxID=2853592 RepID=UPI003571E462|nr:MAG: hypothetical protein KVP17_000570 [Porospora cf. gigantea B]
MAWNECDAVSQSTYPPCALTVQTLVRKVMSSASESVRVICKDGVMAFLNGFVGFNRVCRLLTEWWHGW